MNTLTSERKLVRRHGHTRAELVKRRLYQLKAAACLEDVRHLAGANVHQHVRASGQQKAVFTVNLDHPYRLYFEVCDDREPELPGGGVDWRRVTCIVILKIDDPH